MITLNVKIQQIIFHVLQLLFFIYLIWNVSRVIDKSICSKPNIQRVERFLHAKIDYRRYEEVRRIYS